MDTDVFHGTLLVRSSVTTAMNRALEQGFEMLQTVVLERTFLREHFTAFCAIVDCSTFEPASAQVSTTTCETILVTNEQNFGLKHTFTLGTRS